jgi:hypothetical protein
VVSTTADHPFYVPGKGWVSAAEMPGAKSNGEQEVVYHLNLGEQAIPDQPRPSYPFVGFVAGTLILTADGPKRIEDIKPGEVIHMQADHDQGDETRNADDGEPRWWEDN